MIKLENITKTYTLGKSVITALKEINIDIINREIIAIVGPSGSGKTTLLNLLGCLDKPDSGEIYINNVRLNSLDSKQRAKLRLNTIGFIFQSFNLISVLNVYENVILPLIIDRKRIKSRRKREDILELISEIGLMDHINHKPYELSGGQRQRVAIARSLVNSPDLVLADEPTANLDTKTGMKILNLLRKINKEKGTTFIFSTHDNRILQFADRILYLNDGQISTTSR
ncbi:MAG: ABC transporter ATP-binding protein [Spirochaetales bacterium]|nr:ABC transporter ATP-binding protein [Spirochaetales bacterium]